MARLPIVLDTEKIQELASLGCAKYEIAIRLGVAENTFAARMRDTPEVIAAYEKGIADLKISIRRAQVKAALGGNISMLIFLGKNILGQSDNPEVIELEKRIGEMERRLNRGAAA